MTHPVWMEQDLGGARRVVDRLGSVHEGRAPLLGLARSASRAGDASTAADAVARLQQIWRRADQIPDEVKLKR